MTIEHHKKVTDHLKEALTLDSVACWAYLDRCCRDQPDLLSQAQALLAAAAPQDFLEKPLLECLTAWLAGRTTAQMPDRIGTYKILEMLGQGGMGTVYLANQEEPIKRLLAVKTVRQDLDSREVIARFRSEHQALALMNHENIAAVFDGGLDDGRPYFAMEYVPGIPITQFCKQQKLSLSQRLSLFLQACDGVAHAHQRGILHRDLKPTNVLVAFQEQRTILKIIDFGIAKALNHVSLSDGALHTEKGRLLGTPAYMSPEQLDSNGLDVDARSDVFALGHLLFELLTDTPVHDQDHLNQLPMGRRLQYLAETEAPVPSKRCGFRVSTALPSSAQVKGDLDWITARALAHDRQLRYASVPELSRDLRDYIKGLPISAGPPNISYKLAKYARRHRKGLLVAGSMVGFLIIGSLLLFQNWRAKARAEQQVRNSELRFSVIDEVLQEALLLSNPRDNQDVRRTGALLDKLAPHIQQDFRKHPAILLDVSKRLMHAYISLGDLEKAQGYLDLSLKTSNSLYGAAHCQSLELEYFQAFILFRKGAYREAVYGYRHVEDRLMRSASCDKLVFHRTRRGLANALRLDGKPEQAQPIYEQLLADQKEGDPETLLTLRALGNNQRALNQLAEAEKSFRAAWEGQRDCLGPNHPETISSWENIGLVLSDRGHFAEAEAYFRHSFEVRKDILGPIHPETLNSLSLLGYTLFRLNQLDEAETVLRKTALFQGELLGERAVETMSAQNNLGLVLVSQGKLEDAMHLFKGLLFKQREQLGNDHNDTLKTAGNLTHTYKELGDLKAAENLIRETLAVQESRNTNPDRGVLINKVTLAEVLMKQSKFEASLSVLLEVVADAPKIFPEGHELRAVFTGYLGRTYRELGLYEAAEKQLLPSYQQLSQSKSAFRAELLNDILLLYSNWHTSEREKWLAVQSSLTKL